MTEKSSEDLLKAGWKNMKKCKYANAARCFDKVIDLQPENGDAWHGLAVAKENLEDECHDDILLEEIIENYDRAIELKPESSCIWYGRGLNKAILGDLKGARKDFSRAIELDPENPEYWEGRGVVNRDLEDYESAIADLVQAIDRCRNWDRKIEDGTRSH